MHLLDPKILSEHVQHFKSSKGRRVVHRRKESIMKHVL